MELTILHLFPDFMSLYGEYANVAVLRRHLETMGVTVAVRAVNSEDTPDFSTADMIYMGAGTERKQKIALEKLLPHVDGLQFIRVSAKDNFPIGTNMVLCGDMATQAKS